MTGFRILGTLTQIAAILYCTWRALRSLGTGVQMFYSVPFWYAEFISLVLMTSIWTLGMWYMMERPPRVLSKMMNPQEFPFVDVFIVCMSEPVEVIEPTVIAALNVYYPGAKLAVHVLDDGRRQDIKDMVQRLRAQCK